jgi:uncharacterized protein (TIGR03435 family)
MMAGTALGLMALAAGLQAADLPSFEAASVKPAGLGTPQSMRGGPGTGDPGQFTYSGAPMSRLLMVAYSVKAYQLFGPEWMTTGKFDIVAKVPAGATRQQLNLMLRNLLAERFGLEVHHESRELTGYELTISKEGLKLKPVPEIASSDAAGLKARLDALLPGKNEGMPVFWDRSTGIGNIKLTNGLARSVGVAQPMATLVTQCENRSGLPIVDKTGLTGRYDYSFDYAPDPPANQPDAAATATAMDPGADFVSAFQKQLGLKLEKKKVPIDVLVIDRVNRVPVEN